ncbi:BrnA antitoxin family protein [Ramlibacter sp.]|uniref:BrnA antitoxin family protein n=1 Tax=Ramlibacter sp. TaxID=1917967 RepID=UPI003D136130
MKHAITARLPRKTSAKVSDPDNPPWTEDMLGAPVLKRGRGPQIAPTKVLTSIRLDEDVLAYFKSQGSGYQSRINDTLRKAVKRNLPGRPSAAARKREAD